jgi:XTP/dITP diphosphohydrolase
VASAGGAAASSGGAAASSGGAAASADGGVASAGDAAAAADGAGTSAAELTGERAGDALMALVARVREAGLDPELELRAAARRFADSVREQERSVGSAAKLW